MQEIYGDAWELSKDFDVMCITTNGTIKNNGYAVMGRGIAKEAAIRYPHIAKLLGDVISKQGVICAPLMWVNEDATLIYAFPVKYNWWEKADIELIKKSCLEMVEFYSGNQFTILLPRPGCGYGQLNWEDVKKEIEPLLDDRFYIVHFQKEE